MFWIILGLCVLILIGWTIFCIYNLSLSDWAIGAAIIVLLSLFILALYGAIISSIKWEYKEGEKVEEYELTSLRDDVTSVGEGNRRYISIYAENSYTYYLEADVPTSYGEGTSYKSYTLSGENVFIMEDDKYIDNAKLVKYKCKVKNSFWASPIVRYKVEYVFYVPTGSIVKDISLND